MPQTQATAEGLELEAALITLTACRDQGTDSFWVQEGFMAFLAGLKT
jgi:hypothetical protein